MNDCPEKEAVYKLDMYVSDPDYLKPLFGKHSRRHYLMIQLVIIVLVIESFLLLSLDHSSARFAWCVIPLAILIRSIIIFCISPRKRKEYCEKLKTAGEDHFAYTFYDDCVKIVTVSAEAVLQYDSAEFYAEDNDRLTVNFQFGRAIHIYKGQCNEDELEFIRGIVPEDKQKKAAQKTIRSFILRLILLIFCAALLGSVIAFERKVNNRYHPEYANTTYVSFEACLKAGTISDVVIIEDKYVEYTYTGKGQQTRYYTVYDGDDIDELIAELNEYNTNWKFE